MTQAEIREVANQFKDLSNWQLRMIVMHPNQCAEMAANELLVREVRKNDVRQAPSNTPQL